jgi:hypothetical protein
VEQVGRCLPHDGSRAWRAGPGCSRLDASAHSAACTPAELWVCVGHGSRCWHAWARHWSTGDGMLAEQRPSPLNWQGSFIRWRELTSTVGWAWGPAYCEMVTEHPSPVQLQSSCEGCNQPLPSSMQTGAVLPWVIAAQLKLS